MPPGGFIRHVIASWPVADLHLLIAVPRVGCHSFFFFSSSVWIHRIMLTHSSRARKPARSSSVEKTRSDTKVRMGKSATVRLAGLANARLLSKICKPA